MTDRLCAPVTFPADLDEWDGLCLEWVNEQLHTHEDGAILYVDLEALDHHWRYHAALVLDGLVYDAWNPDVRLAPSEYVAHVFGHAVPWEINPGSEP